MKILVIGHIDHGKTTFICALNKFLYTRFGIGSADRAKPTVTHNNCITSQISVPYSINGVTYTFHDYPGYADYLDMFESGEESYDAALIICAACDGPMPQTRDLFAKCLEAGIEKYVVFLNKADTMFESEMIDIVSCELEEVLAEEGYSDEPVIITGSASEVLEDPNSTYADNIYEVIKAFCQ